MKLHRNLIIAICILVLLLFLILSLLLWPSGQLERVLAICAVMLVIHVTYAGYFLISKLPKIDFPTLVLSGLIGVMILLIPSLYANFWLVGLNFVVIFLAAMQLHSHVLGLKVSHSLNQLCRYKIRLEAVIIALIATEAALIRLLTSWQTQIALVWLGLLIIGNTVVILRDRIYFSPV